VPAYVIFTDRTLDDLLERRPTTLAQLGGCHGIGPAKLEAFGPELLAVVAGREATSVTEGAEPPDRPEPAESVPVTRTAPPDLADRLRAWRLEHARQQDVPAYRIFSNKTLEELSVRAPTTDRELLACSGIGPAKLESFGPDLLALIAAAIDGDPSAPASR
jgi:superfamily II DNA helicase RecQ